jgi:putative endonuclease
VKPFWRRWFGSRSERAAVRFLRRQKFRIVARNYRSNLGELDVVALDHGCIVFVEVRSTENLDPTRPAVSVDRAKQQRLSRLAIAFLQERRLLEHPARFDVLAVCWPAGGQPHFVHHPNAFPVIGHFQMYQ